jgi:hypothetical protein
MRVPVGNPALIGLNIPLTALASVIGWRRKILTHTQENTRRAKLEQLCSTRLVCHDMNTMKLDMQRLQVK